MKRGEAESEQQIFSWTSRDCGPFHFFSSTVICLLSGWRADRPPLCIYAGGLQRRRAAGLSGLFFLPAGARRSAGRALWRFADLLLQIPCPDFCPWLFRAGAGLFPILFFYQGFSASFAVSAFLYAAGEHGILLAFLLFGLRWALVLPCCFFLAAGAVSAPSPPPHRRHEAHPAAPEGLYRVSRFAFCILLLGVGAFFEHLFLPEWLCIVS